MQEDNYVETDTLEQEMSMTDEILSSYQKWFNLLPKIPAISTIILALLFLAIGIIDSSSCVEVAYTKYYGIFKSESFVVEMAIWWLIALFVCTVTYCFTKILLSYKVLHIYYLKSIQEKLKEN